MAASCTSIYSNHTRSHGGAVSGVEEAAGPLSSQLAPLSCSGALIAITNSSSFSGSFSLAICSLKSHNALDPNSCVMATFERRRMGEEMYQNIATPRPSRDHLGNALLQGYESSVQVFGGRMERRLSAGESRSGRHGTPPIGVATLASKSRRD
jgi:hypothetical protein